MSLHGHLPLGKEGAAERFHTTVPGRRFQLGRGRGLQARAGEGRDPGGTICREAERQRGKLLKRGPGVALSWTRRLFHPAPR